MLRILAKTRSSDVLSPVARQLACHWRDSRDYMPLACQLALWLASGSPVGAPLACSFPKIENWIFLAPFSSFVVALGFHRASNTCPPLPTQARKRVEEFLCLTYTIMKNSKFHTNEWFPICITFYWYLCVLLSMYPQKECELEGNRDENLWNYGVYQYSYISILQIV